MIIKNGTAFIDGEFKTGVEIKVEKNRITTISERADAQNDIEILDADGGYIIPGYIDLHIHGHSGRDMMEGSAAVKHMAHELLKHGVTSFLPTTTCAGIKQTRHAINGVGASLDADGATVLGCHMEAPFLNPELAGAQDRDTMLPPSIKNFEEMIGDNEYLVRLITLAPELPGALEFIAEMAARGITVSAGHTMADAQQAYSAFDAGLTHATHFYNAMRQFHHREPGIIGAVLNDERVSAQLITDMIHVHPDALKMAIAIKGTQKIVLVTDAMMAAGLGDGQYRLGGNDVTVSGGVARIAAGNLAGSTLTMDAAVRNCVNMLDLPLSDVLPMASENPAHAIGEDRRGRLAPGLIADVAILYKNLNVMATVVSGKLSYMA